ncbi:MAG: glucose-6-phosphate isomerase [Deltaproteobacteria bacterium]|nr:glucose-6-phosphate isomerase [Deltaproteobacteria bacterium]
MKLTNLASLHGYGPAVARALAELDAHKIMERIWAKDHTVWKPEPTEIANRLAWLHVVKETRAAAPRLHGLLDAARALGCTHAILFGMGGSSLAPEVFRRTFGVAEGALDLEVLDSTDPGAVLAHEARLDPARTLHIVATKSGGTVETFSFFRSFYNRAAKTLGKERAGRHFVAITDPGSKLAEIASSLGFLATLENDPDIGGRYSALSFFGMGPAALLGVPVETVLDRALSLGERCRTAPAVENPAAFLGAALGELAKAGRDKMTLVVSDGLSSLGDWIEQLVAESTGKEGRGVLPVVGEPVGAPQAYGPDRVFVHVRLDGDASRDAAVSALEAAGHPIVRIPVADRLDLGALFFLFELATAVAGERLRINPFDQPDVESAKVSARKVVAEYATRGSLPQESPVLVDGGIEVFAREPVPSVDGLFAFLLEGAAAGAYVALQAYVTPDAGTARALDALRLAIRDRWRVASTVGFGPRFLHSTGQLHKGDRGNGLFVQLTADHARDVAIPDEIGSDRSTMTFGVLIAAQAMGDAEALRQAGRRVVRVHLGADPVAGIERLTRTLG